MLNTPDLDVLICSTLRGERPTWPWHDEQGATEQLLARAHLHGVSALLHSGLDALDWPDGLTRGLRDAAVRQTIWELRHRHLVAEALRTLGTAGIEPVLLKGTVLAYCLYPSPVLRARGDTDLIIPVEVRQRAHELLLSIGWKRELGVSGDFVSYQASYTRRVDGVLHALDLHWKINNSEVLARLFTYEELRRHAQPLAALCPEALGTTLAHALLIACMHRATHRTNPYYVDDVAHHTADRLIWLADIDLLARKLPPDAVPVCIALARAKGLCGVTLEGLQRARDCFHTPVSDLASGLAGNRGTPEIASGYLQAGKFRQQWMDFGALQTWRRRLRLVREVLFPSAAYMRTKFRDHPAPLPWLYLRRAITGLGRRIGLGEQRGPQLDR